MEFSDVLELCINIQNNTVTECLYGLCVTLDCVSVSDFVDQHLVRDLHLWKGRVRVCGNAFAEVCRFSCALPTTANSIRYYT